MAFLGTDLVERRSTPVHACASPVRDAIRERRVLRPEHLPRTRTRIELVPALETRGARRAVVRGTSLLLRLWRRDARVGHVHDGLGRTDAALEAYQLGHNDDAESAAVRSPAFAERS